MTAMATNTLEQTERQRLQNASNDLELLVHEYYNATDKRKKVKKYYVTRNGKTVSPILSYDDMNHFLLGWRNCIANEILNCRIKQIIN